jgi:uncharacterized membrane protein
MDIALWIITGIMVLFFLAAGLMKSVGPIANVRKMPWAQPLSTLTIRLIGVAEVLGAIGLVLPQATNILPVLTPIAAVCLAILMVGATATHRKINDPRSASVTTTVLAATLVVIAAGRIAQLLNLF